MSERPTAGAADAYLCVNCGELFYVPDDERVDFEQYLLCQPPLCDACFESGLNGILTATKEAQYDHE